MFESIRIDPSEIFFGIRTNVWMALAAILVGAIIILVQSRRHPGLEPSPYVPGFVLPAPEVDESEEVYSAADFVAVDSTTGSDPVGKDE